MAPAMISFMSPARSISTRKHHPKYVLRHRAFLFWSQQFAMEAIMNIEDPEVIQLELKYCERCGALWLRLRGAQEISCDQDNGNPRRADERVARGQGIGTDGVG